MSTIKEQKAARALELRQRLMGMTVSGKSASGTSTTENTSSVPTIVGNTTISKPPQTKRDFTMIDNFQGIYEYLHPDYPCNISLLVNGEMRTWPSVSCALYWFQFGGGVMTNSQNSIVSQNDVTLNREQKLDELLYCRVDDKSLRSQGPCNSSRLSAAAYNNNGNYQETAKQIRDTLFAADGSSRQKFQQIPSWEDTMSSFQPTGGSLVAENTNSSFLSNSNYQLLLNSNTDSSAQSPTEDNRLSVLIRILTAKFWQNPELRQEIADTGERTLLFDTTNTWLDLYYGIVESKGGQNQLGHALMRIRQVILKDMKSGATRFLRLWLTICIGLSESRLDRTLVRLDEVKDDQIVDSHELKCGDIESASQVVNAIGLDGQQEDDSMTMTNNTKEDPSTSGILHFVGRDQNQCTLLPNHPSTSRRHAVFVYCKSSEQSGIRNVFGVADCGSKSGVKVNGIRLGIPNTNNVNTQQQNSYSIGSESDSNSIPPIFKVLNEGDKVVIGDSTRHYVVRFDHKKNAEILEQVRQNLMEKANYTGSSNNATNHNQSSTKGKSGSQYQSQDPQDITSQILLETQKANAVKLFVAGVDSNLRKSQITKSFQEVVGNDASGKSRIIEIHVPQDNKGQSKGKEKGEKGNSESQKGKGSSNDQPLQDPDPRCVRGFCFITVIDKDTARRCITMMDKQKLGTYSDKPITVKIADSDNKSQTNTINSKGNSDKNSNNDTNPAHPKARGVAPPPSNQSQNPNTIDISDNPFKQFQARFPAPNQMPDPNAQHIPLNPDVAQAANLSDIPFKGISKYRDPNRPMTNPNVAKRLIERGIQQNNMQSGAQAEAPKSGYMVSDDADVGDDGGNFRSKKSKKDKDAFGSGVMRDWDRQKIEGNKPLKRDGKKKSESDDDDVISISSDDIDDINTDDLDTSDLDSLSDSDSDSSSSSSSDPDLSEAKKLKRKIKKEKRRTKKLAKKEKKMAKKEKKKMKKDKKNLKKDKKAVKVKKDSDKLGSKAKRKRDIESDDESDRDKDRGKRKKVIDDDDGDRGKRKKHS